MHCARKYIKKKKKKQCYFHMENTGVYDPRRKRGVLAKNE